MANMDQSGLRDRKSVKEQDSDSNGKGETEVNFKEEQQRNKKTYGRTPDGSGMLYTCCLAMMPSIIAQYSTIRLAAAESISSICHYVILQGLTYTYICSLHCPPDP